MHLEFIQHHLLLGASHIFITAAFTWGGRLMTSLLRMLRTFIEDGSVSMTSHIDDDMDFIYSLRGITLERDVLKNLQVRILVYGTRRSPSSCLVLSSAISSRLLFSSFISFSVLLSYLILSHLFYLILSHLISFFLFYLILSYLILFYLS